jgi:polysaccharide biosynthesis/export protein
MECSFMELKLKHVVITSFFLAAISLPLLPSDVYGQDPVVQPTVPSGPMVELKKNPIEILKELEPPADAPYELGRGDEITVEVIGRPELTNKHVIGPDGKITLPVAGSVEIANKTREDAAKAIQTALSNFYESVDVSVGVEHYSSNRVLLLGAVEHPGVMTFDGTPLLLEVISRGGMLTHSSTDPPGSATTAASAYPEECVVYRGSNIVFTVQLRQLIEENNNLADYRLKRDDIVYVPGLSKYVSVFGQVLRPGTLQLDSKSTLPQLLAEAGGPTEKAGRSPVIQIIHRGTDQSPGKIQLVAYKDIMQPKALDLTLHTGDVIFVPESGFNGVAYTFEKIAPLVSLFTVGALLRQP